MLYIIGLPSALLTCPHFFEPDLASNYYLNLASIIISIFINHISYLMYQNLNTIPLHSPVNNIYYLSIGIILYIEYKIIQLKIEYQDESYY